MAESSYIIPPGDSLSLRRQIALALAKKNMQPPKIEHWTQGLAHLAEQAYGGYEMGQLAKAERARDKQEADVYSSAPGLPSSPSRAPIAPGKLPNLPPQAVAVPEVGAPQADTRRVPVASSPTVWGDKEAEAAGLYDAPRTAPVPNAGQSGDFNDRFTPTGQAPRQAPGPISAPAPEPMQANISPEMGAYIQRLMSNPRTRAMGLQLYEKQIAAGAQAQFGFQTLPDGTVLRTDPRRGNATPVYQSEVKPTFGELGTDPTTGEPVKGWIDPGRRTTQPVRMQSPEGGPQSVIPAPPPGVDPKVWRKAQSERATAERLPAEGKDVSALRGEITQLPSYKNIAQAAPVYHSMLDAAGRDNRAADVNLIYGMAKIMDPGSVVRESEMTVAQAVATLPEALRANIQSQLQATGRLSPEVRQAIMREAQSRISAYQTMFDTDAGMYRGIAQRNRMNEADVVPKFGPFGEFKAPAPPAQFTPEEAAAELKRRQQGGQ